MSSLVYLYAAYGAALAIMGSFSVRLVREWRRLAASDQGGPRARGGRQERQPVEQRTAVERLGHDRRRSIAKTLSMPRPASISLRLG